MNFCTDAALLTSTQHAFFEKNLLRFIELAGISAIFFAGIDGAFLVGVRLR
jgi:uncharacterized protein YqjF (DUF2071 family)